MKKYYVLWLKSSQVGDSGFRSENYDLESGCPVCGTGAKLKGKLETKCLGKISRDIQLTYYFDMLISEKLYFAIKEVIPSFTLKNIVNSKDEDLNFYHFFSDYNFPKMNSESRGIMIEDDQNFPRCLNCGRSHFYPVLIFHGGQKGTEIVPKKYIYEGVSADFLNKSEVFTTWEHFSASSIRKERFFLARPEIIISETIKEIFESFKIRNMVYEEVIIN
jgi:hypothetical protein